MKPLFESYAFFLLLLHPKEEEGSNSKLCGFKNYWMCLLDYKNMLYKRLPVNCGQVSVNKLISVT